jgi:hypothetical protein
MSRIKDIMANKESNRYKQMKYYRNKLYKEETYNMDCPYCTNALSNYDVKKKQCIHCGHAFAWNNE